MKKNVQNLLSVTTDGIYIFMAFLRSAITRRNPLVLWFFIWFPAAVNAQNPLLNLDFENWTSSSQTVVQGWKDNNTYGPKPVLFVTKVPGQVGNAVRLSTLSAGGPVSGGIYNFKGSLSGGGALYTGSGIPTHLKGYYRCSIALDSAVMYVVLKKGGAVLSMDTFYLYGTQPAFKAFDFTLRTVTTVPDSIVFDAVGGTFNLATFSTNAKVGDYIELDELSFSNGSATYPFPNGSFDTWNTVSSETPDNWQANGSVTKSTDKKTGSYAANLTTKDNGSGVEAATLFGSTVNLSSTGVDTLTGYFKYAATGGDNGYIEITFWDHNGSGASQTKDFLINPAAGYIPFSIPLVNTINASDFNFLISSSYSIPPVNGSSLYIDGLQLKKAKTSGVSTINIASRELLMYPVPAKEILHIAIKGVIVADAEVTIYDISGKAIQSCMLGNGEIDIHDLNAGLYYCLVLAKDQVYHGRFTVAH